VQQLLVSRVGTIFIRSGTDRWAMISAPLKELIAPDMVTVLMRDGDVLRHAFPDGAEELDHPLRMGQVRLRVDDHAAAPVDESRVRVAHRFFSTGPHSSFRLPAQLHMQLFRASVLIADHGWPPL